MTLSSTALVTVAQAKNYMRKDPASTLQVFAEYVGVGDDNTTDFDLDYTPVSGSLRLYVDNVLQVEGTDFDLSSNTVSFDTPPAGSDPITASYDRAASDDTFEDYDDELIEFLINAATEMAEKYTERAFIQRSFTSIIAGPASSTLRIPYSPVVTIVSVAYKKTMRSIGDGTSNQFTLTLTPMSGTLVIYLDGVLQVEDTDYTLSGTAVTFTNPPDDGSEIIFRFNVQLHLGTHYTEQLSIGRLRGAWSAGTDYVVVYTAGYGADRDAAQVALPNAVLGVLSAVAVWYENRLGLAEESVSDLGTAVYTKLGDLPEISRRHLTSVRRSAL